MLSGILQLNSISAVLNGPSFRKGEKKNFTITDDVQVMHPVYHDI